MANNSPDPASSPPHNPSIPHQEAAGAVVTKNNQDRDERGDGIAEMPQEARRFHDGTIAPRAPISQSYQRLVNRNRTGSLTSQDSAVDPTKLAVSVGGTAKRLSSPAGSSRCSNPDDTPSPHGSVQSASINSEVLPSLALRPGLSSPRPSFRPFDRRFSSRITSSGSIPPHALSTSTAGFLRPHSRSVSLASNALNDLTDNDRSAPPWQALRWTKLKKLNTQVFSELAKRNFGTPTCLAVSSMIAVGTSRGVILVFDYNQNVKMVIGPGTKVPGAGAAVESGPITALAFSADHTTLAGGHANGSIFTWDTNRAAKPFLSIQQQQLDPAQPDKRTHDGHLSGAAVIHLGFLGMRHTALVSADDKGMAFSHLASRGTGALGRTVTTTRILGRYPNVAAPPVGSKPVKASTVLAFAPLPLGNVEHGTDSFGLTAMLTPWLLVVVSTTPVAETQHKSPKPREIRNELAVTGCLAWFPAVKLKVPDPVTGLSVSTPKLVYCWSNVMTVLDVDEIAAEDKDKPPDLHFRARSRWRCEEPIVAVQWLGRSVLTVLTITQRLIVLEDQSMRMTEAFDLLHKHVYHVDLFSKQLYVPPDDTDDDNVHSTSPAVHGVIADAFYMSMKTYKSRIFLFGFNDLSIGALSNWADRLIALMEHGDYVAAIHLAASYFTGDANKLTIGLPEDAALRHSMVKSKLVDIMTASLQYTFKNRQQGGDAAVTNGNLKDLCQACFAACRDIDEPGFLFDELYEWYEEGAGGAEDIFVEALEPYVLDETIRTVPPAVVKAIVTHFVKNGWEGRLEDMICHMDTATLDLDQITGLCKQHGLYEALIYVWNQALNDYVTPLIDLLTLLLPMMQNGIAHHDAADPSLEVNALKIFPYLSYALTGRVYPTGDMMDEETASHAKSELYWFLFSGKSIEWPRGSGRRLITRPDLDLEPPFPYLRMVLKYDAPSLLSVLNEAFEDSFLNDSPDKPEGNTSRSSISEVQLFALSVDRQYIISILRDIMTPADFAVEDTIYLDMFIARNVAKFSQYLLLPDSTLQTVLSGLCNYPGQDLADDAQLSAEYLLSVYHLPNLNELVPSFTKAGFFRILKRIYQSDGQYDKLIDVHFDDTADKGAVFECISGLLQPKRGLNKRQLDAVYRAIRKHAHELVEANPDNAATTLQTLAPSLYRQVLETIQDEPYLQYLYLKPILEPTQSAETVSRDRDQNQHFADRGLIEHYVRLMCQFDAQNVSNYIDVVQTADLRLEVLLPAIEGCGAVDAAVMLLARADHTQEAMQRLVKHLETLESTLQGILSAAGHAEQVESLCIQDSAEKVIQSLHKFTHVGIWLCQSQTARAKASREQATETLSNFDNTESLLPEEMLWLDLIDTTAQITRRISDSLQSAEVASTPTSPVSHRRVLQSGQFLDTDRLGNLLRSLVQDTFTALLAATSAAAPATAHASSSDTENADVVSTYHEFPFSERTPSKQSCHSSTTPKLHLPPRTSSLHGPTLTVTGTVGTKSPLLNPPISFLRILRAFLTRAAAASPSLADLRQVLASIFSAYAYEARILDLFSKLFDKSLFASVRLSVASRSHGWRPRSATCEICRRRVWGAGAVPAGKVIETWEERERASHRRRQEKRSNWIRQSMEDDSGSAWGGGGFASDAVVDDWGYDGGADASLATPGQGGSRKGKEKLRAGTGLLAAELLSPPQPRPSSSSSSHSDSHLTPTIVNVVGGEPPGITATSTTPADGRVGNYPHSQLTSIHHRTSPTPLSPLIVFACRHIFHRTCLDKRLGRDRDDDLDPRDSAGWKCPLHDPEIG